MCVPCNLRMLYTYLYSEIHGILLYYSYAASRIEALRQGNQLRPRSRFATWQPISMTELREFLAIVLNMGLIDVPTLEGYWTTSWEAEIPFSGGSCPGIDFYISFGCSM